MPSPACLLACSWRLAGAAAASQLLRPRCGAGCTGGGGSPSGLLVIDAESGEVVCAQAAEAPRPLASNTKLFTTATALGLLGPDNADRRPR